MSVSLPNGAIITMAAAYGPLVPTTIVTNSLPAVLTAAAHGVLAGEFAEITSNWERLNAKIVQPVTVTANTLDLSGVDTTSVVTYPAGGGLGFLRRIISWVQLAQILESDTNGGEQQFEEYQFLESSSQKRIPTTKSASGLTFSVADDPTLLGYQQAALADEDRKPRAIRINLPNGGVLLYNAFVSLNKTPSLTVNRVMAVEVTLSLLSDPVRY